MVVARFYLICLLFLIPGVLLGADVRPGGNEQHIGIRLTKDAGMELQLEVRQTKLNQVLDELASKTGVVINYSVLPEETITATCAGTSVKQLLDCLFDHKADIIFRYPEVTSKVDSLVQPAEVWVLGTTFGKEHNTKKGYSVQCPLSQQNNAKVPRKVPEEPDQTDGLIKMAVSEVPKIRAQAIGRLLAGGREGDEAVKITLEQALTDKDAGVRVQAISSYALREGEKASAALQDALHDSETSVRLAAVNSAGSDVALLQQALTDNDASVRQLATLKLKPLLKINGN